MLSHRSSPEREHTTPQLPHAVSQQEDHFGSPRGSQSVSDLGGGKDLLQRSEEEAGMMVADFEALWGEGGSETMGSGGNPMEGKGYSSDRQEGLERGIGGGCGEEEGSGGAWRARSKGVGSLEEGTGGVESLGGKFGKEMESSVEEFGKRVETEEGGKELESMEKGLRKDMSAKNEAQSSEVKVQCDVEEGEVSDSDHEDVSRSDSQQTLDSQVWLRICPCTAILDGSLSHLVHS